MKNGSLLRIQRERWVIVRDGTHIFCGLARNFKFKPIDDIGDTPIKTYLSRNKAISSFNSSWTQAFNGERYECIKITVQFEEGATK